MLRKNSIFELLKIINMPGKAEWQVIIHVVLLLSSIMLAYSEKLLHEKKVYIKISS